MQKKKRRKPTFQIYAIFRKKSQNTYELSRVAQPNIFYIINSHTTRNCIAFFRSRPTSVEWVFCQKISSAETSSEERKINLFIVSHK